MKQTLTTFTFLMISFLNGYSQKEIFFNNAPSKDIKVESLQGLEINYSKEMDLSKTPIYIGYFNEKRISSEWTLNSTIGFYNVFGTRRTTQLITDSTGYSNFRSGPIMNIYTLALGAGIEPRWYWGYKKRFQSGKAQLNSGFFLSFPLSVSTTMLQTPDPLFNPKWTPAFFNVNVSFIPTVGYRQAISERLYLEGSIGVGLNSAFYKYQNTPISFASPNINPLFKLKAAYTFK